MISLRTYLAIKFCAAFYSATFIRPEDAEHTTLCLWVSTILIMQMGRHFRFQELSYECFRILNIQESQCKVWFLRALNWPKSHTISFFVFLFGFKPKDQIKTLSDIKNWTCNRISLSFIFEKRRVPISRSLHKDCRCYWAPNHYERIIVKIRKKERGRGEGGQLLPLTHCTLFII